MLKLKLFSILAFLSLIMYSLPANSQPNKNNQTGLEPRFSNAPRRPHTQLETLFQKGRKLASQQCFLEAKEIFTSVINADPNFADAYAMRATTFVLTNNRLAGAADLRMAAKLFKTQGQPELAKQLLKQSMQLSENPVSPGLPTFTCGAK